MSKKKTVPRKKGTESDSNRSYRLLNTSFGGQGRITIEVEKPTEDQAQKNGRYVGIIRRMTREAFGGPDLHVGE